MIFGKFVEVSHIDVDAGCIWVGDPCYVLKDSAEKRPKDLGKNWGDICSQFFERSGYDAAQEQGWEWEDAKRNAFHSSPAFDAWDEKYEGDPTRNDRGSAAQREREAIRLKVEKEYEAKHPRPGRMLDKGFANFTHDLGHGGMGTMLSTCYGDGSYPVKVQYNKDGRIRKVLIDFDDRGPLKYRIKDFFLWTIPNSFTKLWKKLRSST